MVGGRNEAGLDGIGADPHAMSLRPLLLTAALALVACHSSDAGGPPKGFGPMPAQVAKLTDAIQNDGSSRDLVKAGVRGQLDYEQRHSQRLAAETDVKAAEAQVQAQGDLLRFYNITAPGDGVVGDVPVKIGDYVSQQT